MADSQAADSQAADSQAADSAAERPRTAADTSADPVPRRSARGAAGSRRQRDPGQGEPPPPVRRGPGRPRSQPLAEQRRRVLDAARTVFAQHGYHGATIEAVARGAGTPRPTVYELFGNKDDLFAAVIDDAAERVVSRLSASFTESEDYPVEEFVRHNFAAVFDLFEQDRDAVTVLLNAEQGSGGRRTAAPDQVRSRVLQEVSEFTRSRWEHLGVPIGDGAEIMGLMFFRMAEGLAIRQADQPGWDREAFIDLLTEFTLGGITRLWEQAQDVLVAAGRHTGGGRGSGG